jgi:hypothetical protein
MSLRVLCSMADSEAMRSGALMAAGLAGCIALQARGGDEGDEALRRATTQALSAPYLVVTHGGGRELFLSRNLTVIKRRGRVVAWTAANEEFTWRTKPRCYDRRTDFNRDDARQQRRGVVPPKLNDSDVSERSGVRVISAREEHIDFPDTEFELHVDRSDRPTRLRQRSAEFGVIRAGRWQTTRYRYPTRRQFARLAGPAPAPRCG